MGRNSDWDDELSKDTKQRRHNRRRRKANADEQYMDKESSEFIRTLESSKGTGWMAEKKYKQKENHCQYVIPDYVGSLFHWLAQYQ